MKTLKLILNFLFEKIPSVTMVSLILVVCALLSKAMILDKEYSLMHFMLGTMMFATPILFVLVILMDKMYMNKTWKKFNYVFCLVTCICGYFLLKDLGNRPYEYSESNQKAIVTELKDSKIAMIDINGDLYKCEKSNIKYDSLHPLKVYDSYKIDIFGYKTLPGLVLKSDLMIDYTSPTCDR